MGTRTRIDRAKHRVDDFVDVLYMDYWTAKDLNGTFEERQSIIEILREDGLVDKVGRTRFEDGNKWGFDRPEKDKLQQVYAWRDGEIQGRIQAYYENRNELPCNCRSHIPPETDDKGRYICKFCGDKHSRDVIQNAL